jgi:hypothetical protein
MHRYLRLLGSGALTLFGMGATILVHGGWQAVACAFAIFQGIVFAVTFLELGQAGERSQSGRPAWALADRRPPAVPESIAPQSQAAASRQPHDARSRPAAGATT